MALTDQELLKMIRKLLAETAGTSASRQPWQELLNRHPAVPSRAVRAADVVRGFVGSWAASYLAHEEDSVLPASPDGQVPVPVSNTFSRIGKPGLPETNFVPYAHNTNQYGLKGPSLLGHPVSFEVVGPTLKNPMTGTWSWEVDVDGTKLTKIGGPAAQDVPALYGINASVLPDVDDVPFFLVVSDSGIDKDPRTPHTLPNTGYMGKDSTSKWEVFRVEEIRQNIVRLDPSKPIHDHFIGANGDPAVDRIKGITLLRPFVAELALVPGTEGKTWAAVPPERAAGGDSWPTYQDWTGSASHYGGRVALPIPRVGKRFKEHMFVAILASNAVPGPLPAREGTWVAKLADPAFYDRVQPGDVINIGEVNGSDDGDLLTPREYRSLLGFFEVVEGADSLGWFRVRMKEDIDPVDGSVFLGGSDLLCHGTMAKFVALSGTVHRPMSSLDLSSGDLDLLDSVRLTGLIDPREVGRTAKVPDGPGSHPEVGGGRSGLSAARPDRATFDTAAGNDPGSLLDLGFRMVIFPSKVGIANTFSPDWDRALTSREATLDPSLVEDGVPVEQWVDIDYAAGLVHLSHTPGEGGDLSGPAPRLWAAFVPYSMEGSQSGSSVRITGGDLNSANIGVPDTRQRDVLSQKKVWAATTGQTFADGGTVEFLGDPEGFLPLTGWVEVINQAASLPYWNDHEDQPHKFPLYYEGWSKDTYGPDNLPSFKLHNVRVTPNHPDPMTIDNLQGVQVRMRPDVRWEHDYDRGSNVRSDVIRLDYANLTYNQDGSISVMPTAVAGPAEELRGYFPLATESEVGRFHLEKDTLRWTTDDPPWMASGHTPPPLQHHEIGVEVSRGRLYTHHFIALGAHVKRVAARAVALGWETDDSNTLAVAVPRVSASPATGGEDLSHFYAALGGGDKSAETTTSLLCLNIEGSEIVSGAVGTNPFAPIGTDLRVVFNLKRYGDDLWAERRHGPANPVDWVSMDTTAATTTQEIAENYNTEYGVKQFFTTGQRLHMAGRQISTMPTQPWLVSDRLNFPLTTVRDMSLGLVLRSADPSNAKNWISFTFTLPAGAYNTALVLAGELNRLSLDPNLLPMVTRLGQVLDSAGFRKGRSTSPNPEILATPWPHERQFTWVANNDPRVSAWLGDHHIALICSGHGEGHMGQPFHNIVIEVVSASVSDGSRNLCLLLGRDFVPDAAARETYVSCGLFHGRTSKDLQPPYVPLAAFMSWPKLLGAQANEYLGFPTKGFEPLGETVGSWRIVETEIGLDKTVYTVEMPRGAGNPNYGDQSGGGSRDIGLIPEFPSHRPVGGLAKWSWPRQNSLQVIDINVDNEAGVVGVFTTFSTTPHGEEGYRTPLMAQSRGYRSWLAYMEQPDAEAGEAWEQPQLNFRDVARGDFVNLSESSDEGFGLLQGRVVLTEDETESSTGKKGIWVLVNPLSCDPSGTADLGGSPNLWHMDPTQALVGGPGLPDTTAQIIPSATSTGRGAVRHDNPHWELNSESSDEYGLATPRDGQGRAFAMIGAGRISLYSPLGPSEATGLTFLTPSTGRYGSREKWPTSTYLEAGVFSTSFQLGQGGIDSAGVFDHLYGVDQGTTGQYYWERSGQIGGVGGLRVSGDAHVWIENLRPFESFDGNAFVRSAPNFQNLVPHINNFGTGAVTGASSDIGSGHAPGGWSTRGPGVGKVLQEATIHLGLTAADVQALRAFSLEINITIFDLNALGPPTAMPGESIRRVGDRSTSNAPQLVSSLVGCFLELTGDSDGDIRNRGTWRIAGAPLLQASGTRPAFEIGIPGAMGRIYDMLSPYGPAGQQHTPRTDQLQHPPTLGQASYTPDYAHPPVSTVVAFLECRVERFSDLPGERGAPTADAFQPDARDAGRGWDWKVWRDKKQTQAIWVADVIDPGGSPTGSPRSFRGLTLNPWRAAGRSDLPIQLTNLLGDPYKSMPGSDVNIEEGYRKADGRLLGIHDTLDSRGKHHSRAVFAVPKDAVTVLYSVKRARMLIHASEGAELDGGMEPGTFGEFEVDEAGRVNFMGMPRRLGPGILMDGGLGLVQATAFRSLPRPAETEDIGSMTVYGRGGYPFANYLSDVSQRGRELPSTFNRAEFYDEVTIASPNARLTFESPWAAEGLAVNYRPALLSSMSYPGPNSFARSRIHLGVEMATSGVPLPDTIFPTSSSGIRFKTPGAVVYDRAFRTVDAQGSRPNKAAYFGNTGHSGIPGMEIPAFGECLLLPQGPPTLHGEGAARFGGRAKGVTPLDCPLFEFVNAAVPTFGSTWGISCLPLFGSHGNREMDPNAGYGPHYGSPGSVSQAYRHSRSREDEVFYGWESATARQMRLLDGMVIEDIDNGTFYTVGDVGRWRTSTNLHLGLGRPGDGNRSSVCGSQVVAGEFIGGHQGPEVIYDVGPHCHPLLNPFTQPWAGQGDRVDDDVVRRIVSGRKVRITPNVEFVPVLGPRGVLGSLVPPVHLGKYDLDYIEGADAIFYDEGYAFKAPGPQNGAGDVGRLLYLCGTSEYKYTGWWMIIDVIPDFSQAFSSYDAAVLRKFKGRGMGPIEGNHFGDGAFPMTTRSPHLKSVGDHKTNDRTNNGHFSGNAGDYSDVFIQIGAQPNSGAPVVYASHTIFAGDMALGPPAPVLDADSAVAYLNGNDHSNGKQLLVDLGIAPNMAASSPFLMWYTMAGSQTIGCLYNKTLLTPEQWRLLTDHPAAGLQIQWQTRIDGNHSGPLDSDESVGFLDGVGHNSSVDGGWGDRNSGRRWEFPMGVSTMSAAAGIRWVFSSPLSEEHAGSYVHLERPRIYRYGTRLNSQNDGAPIFGLDLMWTSGHQMTGDHATGAFDVGVEIFRVNRCPNTTNMLLGGDCEVYYPEIIEDLDATVTERGGGRPVMYSPLSIAGNWPDGNTGRLPLSYANNIPVMYTLQPIGRERIVTVSPTSARSNPIITRGYSDKTGTPQGPQGVGPAVAVGPGSPASAKTNSFSLMSPWQLVGRGDVHRTSMAHAGTLGAYDSRVELNNSNNPDPDFTNFYDGINQVLPLSTYCWAPAGEWWQLYQPAWDTHGPDASHAPPTLRVDLTETFTQAMGPGSGINSPHSGRAPKGARLNRLWVNFGMFGREPHGRGWDSTPGFVDAGGLNYNAVLNEFYMAFNLILEIPGSQAKSYGKVPTRHSRASGTSGFPFGGRTPTAAATHHDNSGNLTFPGGTIVVPLYVNREAGDLMPNVMERFVTVGPEPAWNDAFATPPTGQPEYEDWAVGHYEMGLGAGSFQGNASSNYHTNQRLTSNSFNPIMWGGIDFASAVEGGAYLAAGYCQASATPFPRSSKVSGGLRSMFTSGISPDGTLFSKPNAHSLSAAAMTGIVIAHSAETLGPRRSQAGSYSNEGYEGPTTSPHAFTVALTPVGDAWYTPKDGTGQRISVSPSAIVVSGSETLKNQGRTLSDSGLFSDHRHFKVGNWLDVILERYGLAAEAGSMLPPGARVFLEIACGPGNAAALEDPNGLVASGSWVGDVKLSFDIETADGTAWTTDVNILGDEES